MDKLFLTDDIRVYCITATSFPDGVEQAHKQLHELVPFDANRRYFGLSWPGSNGQIIYKAAAEELHPGEFAQHSLEIKTIISGNYLYIDVPDFMNDIAAIGKAFEQLIHDDRHTPDGFCIEWYLTQQDCRCMLNIK